MKQNLEKTDYINKNKVMGITDVQTLYFDESAIKESGMAEYDCPDIEAIFSNGHADAPVGTLSDNEKIRHQLWADAVIAFTIAEYGDPPLSANIVLTAYDKRFNNG